MRDEWNDNADCWVWTTVLNEEIFAVLRRSCLIDEGVTLGDIFRIVDSNYPLMMFLSQYSWCSHIRDFHHQANEPRVDRDEKILYLEVYPSIEVIESDFYMGFGFHGVGEDDYGYSVSYTPMNELAHLPVKVRTEGQIERYENGQEKITYRPSLLEVLDAIYWDISFMGGPEDNVAFLGWLNTAVGDVIDRQRGENDGLSYV
jgi:hypothetical protein